MPKLYQPGFEKHDTADREVHVFHGENGAMHAGAFDETEARIRHLAKDAASDLLFLTGLKQEMEGQDDFAEPSERPDPDLNNKNDLARYGDQGKTRSHNSPSKEKK